MIVITAGILGAFALNNWNSHRLEREEIQSYLIRIKDDLPGIIDINKDFIEAHEQSFLFPFDSEQKYFPYTL